MSGTTKNFDILTTERHTLFSSTKLLSDLYLVKFLNSSAKSFFP